MASIESCLNDLDYLENSIEQIQDKWLSTKLLYRCTKCGLTYSLTFEEVEARVRELVAFDVMNFRKIHMFKHHLDPTSIDYESDFVFCGACAGVDGEGNCYANVVDRCTIKNKK